VLGLEATRSPTGACARACCSRRSGCSASPLHPTTAD
jgi:hypothetical protein